MYGLKWLPVTLLSAFLYKWGIITKAEQPWNEKVYHQNDYDLTLDIAELIEYNRSYLRNPKLAAVPLTRTQRVFNGSMYLLQDLTRDIRMYFQVLKLMSNEYRYFPLNVSVNLCDEYDRNLFNARNIVHNVSNLRSCPPKKGFYYVKNGIPEYSKLPPFFPRGSFKGISRFFHKSDFIAHVEVRRRIVDKPIKWKN